MKQQQVNTIHHLNSFYDTLQGNVHLRANDISVYLALFRLWNRQELKNPFQVKQEEVLTLSRINSNNTYSKCLKRLAKLKYIIYQPSPAPFIPSNITILPLAPEFKAYTKDSPHPQYSSSPDLTSLTDNNSISRNKQASSPPKKIGEILTYAPPQLTEIAAFFQAAGLDVAAAHKFFHNNEAAGWLINGHRIVDWKAVAQEWIELHLR
jgi:hypothetical protein